MVTCMICDVENRFLRLV